jgi:hypothetical protein
MFWTMSLYENISKKLLFSNIWFLWFATLTLKTAVRFDGVSTVLNSSHCHEYTFLLAWGDMKGVFIIWGGGAAAKVTSGILQHLCIFLLTPSFQCILTVQSSLMLGHPTGMLLIFVYFRFSVRLQFNIKSVFYVKIQQMQQYMLIPLYCHCYTPPYFSPQGAILIRFVGRVNKTWHVPHNIQHAGL